MSNPTQNGRRDRIAERVNDQDVHREPRCPHRWMGDIGQDRIGWAGVEEEEELGQENIDPRQGEASACRISKNERGGR